MPPTLHVMTIRIRILAPVEKTFLLKMFFFFKKKKEREKMLRIVKK